MANNKNANEKQPGEKEPTGPSNVFFIPIGTNKFWAFSHTDD
jgi:hypothetical protein